MRLLICVLAGAVTIGSAGCASMANYESIPVESDPPGADVLVECGAIRLTTVTPGTVLLSRSAPDCRVSIRKEGYREQVRWLRRGGDDDAWLDALALAVVGGGVVITSSAGGGPEAEVAGEVLVYGILPWIINVASCNYCDHEPKQLNVVLRPRGETESQ